MRGPTSSPNTTEIEKDRATTPPTAHQLATQGFTLARWLSMVNLLHLIKAHDAENLIIFFLSFCNRKRLRDAIHYTFDNLVPVPNLISIVCLRWSSQVGAEKARRRLLLGRPLVDGGCKVRMRRVKSFPAPPFSVDRYEKGLYVLFPWLLQLKDHPPPAGITPSKNWQTAPTFTKLKGCL